MLDLFPIKVLEIRNNKSFRSLTKEGYCHFHGFPLTKEHPSIEQAVIWIARLGEFLARRHDGFPGVKTIWRGLQRLHDITSSWKLLHSSESQDL